jgi:hypothetical protein
LTINVLKLYKSKVMAGSFSSHEMTFSTFASFGLASLASAAGFDSLGLASLCSTLK